MRERDRRVSALAHVHDTERATGEVGVKAGGVGVTVVVEDQDDCGDILGNGLGRFVERDARRRHAPERGAVLCELDARGFDPKRDFAAVGARTIADGDVKGWHPQVISDGPVQRG